jgi:hypothetical protein
MTSETTIEDRIAARIARIADARDQVVRTLVADLKASIRGAEAGGQVANPLERRAVEVLERLIAPDVVTLHKPAAMGKTTDLGATCVVVDDDPAFEEGPVTLDDPRFAAHPVAQANAASWPRPKRTRRPTRAEKIAASKAGA